MNKGYDGISQIDRKKKKKQENDEEGNSFIKYTIIFLIIEYLYYN